MISVLLFLCLGVAGMVHHWHLTGLWFQVEQIHHETLVLMCFGIGVVLLVKNQLERWRSKE